MLFRCGREGRSTVSLTCTNRFHRKDVMTSRQAFQDCTRAYSHVYTQKERKKKQKRKINKNTPTELTHPDLGNDNKNNTMVGVCQSVCSTICCDKTLQSVNLWQHSCGVTVSLQQHSCDVSHSRKLVWKKLSFIELMPIEINCTLVRPSRQEAQPTSLCHDQMSFPTNTIVSFFLAVTDTVSIFLFLSSKFSR